jgi:hypothetical protein
MSARARYVLPDDPEDSQQTQGSEERNTNDDGIDNVRSYEATSLRSEVEAGEIVDREGQPNQDIGDQECGLLSGGQMNNQRNQQNEKKDQSERYQYVVSVPLPEVVTIVRPELRYPAHQKENVAPGGPIDRRYEVLGYLDLAKLVAGDVSTSTPAQRSQSPTTTSCPRTPI